MSHRAASLFIRTASSFTFFFALLLIVGGSACGRSGLDDYDLLDGGFVDGGPDVHVDGAPGGCDATSCPTGCCDTTGRCRSGDNDNACGSAGIACKDCRVAGWDFCDATRHACGDRVGACGPANCPSGCCDRDICFAGTDPNACGSAGEACQQCQALGLGCSNYACVKPSCGPDNCAGCCFGNQCLAGTDATACGQSGQQCANCAAQGEVCVGVGGASGGVCKATTGCSPETCSGCCDANGACQQGTAANACGSSGRFCQNCQQLGEFCQNQQCAPNPSCGPWNCQGCCDSGGNCRSGVFDDQCGQFGNSCFDCEQMGDKCINQQCAPPNQCNAQTCPFGCCDGSGLCQPGFSPFQCGNFGNLCQDCAQLGETCSNQQCGFEGGGCNAQTCPFGCCDPFGVCQPGFAPTQCGNFGNFCQNCLEFGETCGNQQCVFEGGGCNPQTCPFGCCDPFGTCQPGFSPFQCGNFGNFCQNCQQFGETCNNQQCTLEGGGCNAQTCPNGCCDPFGVCQPGVAPNACGGFGNFCQNCAQLGEQCNNQQCVPSCSQSCQGCCDAKGNCQAGFLDSQCGQFGNGCQDCTALMPPSTCDVGITPRGCASQQMICPSSYAGCPSSLQEPTPTKQSACSTIDLKNAAAACSAGAHTAACSSFFQFEFSSNFACANCLQPFDFDFSENSGVFECVAPFVDASCNHNSACLLDCTQQSCGSCQDPAASAMCQNQVSSGMGQCSTFYQGNQCVTTALAGPAAVCNPATYMSNFGAWLQGVGGQYCGQ